LGRVERLPTALGYSPLAIRQEDIPQSNNGFPGSKEEFRVYMDNLPFEQRVKEGEMLFRDLRMAASELADFLFWQTVEDTRMILEGKRVVADKSATIVGLVGFHSPESAFWGMKVYMGNRGHRVIIFHPEAPLNVRPMKIQEVPFMRLLEQVKEEIGDDNDLVVVGHSRGAILNMITAIRHPDFHRSVVSRSINLGGPIPEWVNSTLGQPYLWWQDIFGGDDFSLSELRDSVDELNSLNFTSLGSPNDLVVRGIHPGKFIRINGSHSGMPSNRKEVLPKIGEIISGKLNLAA